MKWKDVFAKDLIGFMKVINSTLRYFLSNLNENNLKLKQIEIIQLKAGETAPPPTPNKAIFYFDAAGNVNIIKPDGTIIQLT